LGASRNSDDACVLVGKIKVREILQRRKWKLAPGFASVRCSDQETIPTLPSGVELGKADLRAKLLEFEDVEFAVAVIREDWRNL
jgi:hypothetical protein